MLCTKSKYSGSFKHLLRLLENVNSSLQCVCESEVLGEKKDDYCVMFLDSSRAILERKPHAYISNRRQKFNSSAANR